ncbi:MAG: UDP binding domain-containing protein, partial [Pseudomonadota bacterium]
IGILGFAFKAGTGDCRESPVLAVIDNLLLNNFAVVIYDKNVSHDSLPAKYRDIAAESIEQVVANADLIVIGNNTSEFANISDILAPEQIIIDLVGCNI